MLPSRLRRARPTAEAGEYNPTLQQNKPRTPFRIVAARPIAVTEDVYYACTLDTEKDPIDIEAIQKKEKSKTKTETGKRGKERSLQGKEISEEREITEERESGEEREITIENKNMKEKGRQKKRRGPEK